MDSLGFAQKCEVIFARALSFDMLFGAGITDAPAQVNHIGQRSAHPQTAAEDTLSVTSRRKRATTRTEIALPFLDLGFCF
jgi:hypothetical protein